MRFAYGWQLLVSAQSPDEPAQYTEIASHPLELTAVVVAGTRPLGSGRSKDVVERSPAKRAHLSLRLKNPRTSEETPNFAALPDREQHAGIEDRRVGPRCGSDEHRKDERSDGGASEEKHCDHDQ
jgi:hypothetical protein